MEVHVPFLKGLHEETEKRLLPQGYLTRAENVRFEKEGRVVSRNGYAFVDGAPETADRAAVNYDARRTVHFVDGQGAFPAQWYQRKPDGTFTDAAYASCMSTMEAPRRTVATPTIRFSAIASDIATADGYLFVVYNDYDAVNNTTGGLFFSVYERQTMTIVDSGVIVEYGEAASSYFNQKCIALGDDILVFYVKDDALLMYKYTPSTLTGADVTLSPTVTWAAPVPGHHTSFDVCLFDADEVAVCTEFVVATVSTGVAVYRINASGSVVLAFTNTSYGAEPKQVAISPNGVTNQFAIAAVTDGNTKWGLFSGSGTVLTAVSDIDASGDALGSPCMNETVLAWGRIGTPAGSMGVWLPGTLNPVQYVQALWPVCKPFRHSSGPSLVWCVDQTHDPAGTDNQAGTYGTYRLVQAGTVYLRDADAGETVCEVVCAQEQALAGNWYYGEAYDQRRKAVVLDEEDENGQALIAYIAPLPTLVGLATTAGRVDFVEFKSGAYTEKLFPARLNGQLFFSGPRLKEFDGSQLYESGLYAGPKEFSLGTETGAMEGLHQFLLVWKWIDAGGRIHRSAPSDPQSITLNEPAAVTITVAPPPFSDRAANGSTTIFVEAYATLMDESDFHLVNPDERYVYSPDLATPLTITLDFEDADIEDNELVYTAIGELANVEPPPCKYVWAGEDRLLMGGLEDPSMYQFSKKVRPGYAVAFSEEEKFKGTIEGVVTGVAQLDGQWFVGSRENIWTIVGQGPDENGGGEFSPPRKLPSDTGFTSFRSILEVPQGLLFQGKGNRMFLLPRGGAAPQWIGRSIQDTLNSYPFITCATYLPEENIAVFACRSFDDGDEDADGRLLIFDTDAGEWVTDSLFQLEDNSARIFNSLTTYGSKLLFDGHIEETEAWTDDWDGASPTWITCHLVTGDVRFFGANGYGRCRNAMVLGEALSDFVNLSLQVSRDSGDTWDTPAGSFSPSAWTDQLEYPLPYVRGDTFRFWITVSPCDDGGVPTPGEGAALNALSCEVFPSSGLKKLPAEKRA